MGAPDYYKSTLLYGLYEGEPIIVACDKFGRLILVSETFDRWGGSGRVILSDDFTAGLTKCAQRTSGTGAAIALDYDEALSGGISCKLTGGSTLDRTAFIGYTAYPNTFTKFGVEVCVRLGESLDTFRIRVGCYTGAMHYTAQLRYNFDTQDWEVYNYSTDAWVAVIEDVPYGLEAYDFVPLKLTIDVDSGIYEQLQLLWTEADLSSYALDSAASVEPGRLTILLEAKSDTNLNGWLLLDNLFVTQDEP